MRRFILGLLAVVVMAACTPEQTGNILGIPGDSKEAVAIASAINQHNAEQAQIRQFWAEGNQRHLQPFLVCTRGHESAVGYPYPNDQNYGAVSGSGTYRGAYQFKRSTWDNVARRAGRPDLVGVDPAQASVYDQDLLAWLLYIWEGNRHWGGRC